MGRRRLREFQVTVTLDNAYHTYVETFDVENYDSIRDLLEAVEEWAANRIEE